MSAGGGPGYWIGGVMGIPRIWVPTGPSPSDAVISPAPKVETGRNVPVNIVASTPAPAPAAYTPPPPPAPILPNYKPAIITNKNFKVAPSDIIQFDDSSIEIALITDLLFEDIGATELANISRSDLIDGQSVIYAPIKNLPTIRREFNPNNIVATAHDTDYFSRFAIDLSLRGIYEPYFSNDGDLMIEIETVGDNEEIQVQILTNGTIDLVEII
jgi:hypothetical protein